MANVGSFISAPIAFPGIGSDLVTLCGLLEKLSRTDVLFWCARLLHRLSNPSEFTQGQRQVDAVKMFFPRDAIDHMREFDIARRRKGGGPTTVFFRGQLLELIRWAVLVCEDQPVDGRTFEDVKARHAFGKAALIASEVWGERVSGDTLGPDEDPVAARNRALGPFRKGIEASQLAPEMPQAVGRGWEIFHELIPSIDGSFLARFEATTGLSIDDYYNCCIALTAEFMKPGSEATIFDGRTLGKKTRHPELIQQFVNLECQTAAELRSALWGEVTFDEAVSGQLPIYDYRPMREKPLLRASDGRTIIIDPVFWSDKASVGPLFHVLRDDKQNANELFASFGKAFERYAQNLLRRCFPDPGGVLRNRLLFNLPGPGTAFEVDALLDYGLDVVLFEIKGVWLPEAQLGPGNELLLWQTLSAKYGASNKNRLGSAEQLARASNAVARGAQLGHWAALRGVKRVIPVVVAFDGLLSAPTYGCFLAREFQTALIRLAEHEQPRSSPGDVQIVGPVIVTADLLEILETSLKNFSLLDALKDYDAADPERLSSLWDFISTSPKYKDRIRANQSLASIALDRLEAAKKRLFDA